MMRPLKAENCIFFLLNKACQVGNRYWSAAMAPCSVTGSQGLVLAFLLEQDQVTATELGKRIHVDNATLTGVLDRLTASGLITRRKKPDDRRATLICLTDKGRETADLIRQKMTTASHDFLSHLSDIEAKLLRSLLRNIMSE